MQERTISMRNPLAPVGHRWPATYHMRMVGVWYTLEV